MKHAEIRSVLAQGIRSTIASRDALPKQPRPYQVETLESCIRWLELPEGTKRAYVSHATGLGKTVLFAIIVASAPSLRSLIVVPTKALLEQTARKVVQFTGGLLGHLSSLANIEDEAGEDVVAVRGMDHSSILLTTDASFNKLAARIRQQFDPHLIIRDECHWGYDPKALAALDSFEEAVAIGFSATPDYLTTKARDGYLPVQLENGRTLYGPRDKFAGTHFQTCLDRRTVRWGIEEGWLAPLAWGLVEFDVSLKSVPIVNTEDGPDYHPSKLQELMSKHWTVMCETVRRLYEKGEYDLPHRQVFAVCPSVLAAEELAEAIASLGISSACITGKSTTLERNVILPAFNEKEVRFLTSVMVLREGWDAPNAEVCMMLRPTVSRVLYEQPMGRVLRRPEGNPDKVALVLDAHFQGRKLCPLSAPAIYGKPGDEIRLGDMLMGDRRKSGDSSDFRVSPYLPKNADPRIVVVDMFDHEAEVEHRAGPDGTFEADGETWGTKYAASLKLGISLDTIIRRVAKGGIRSKGGKGRNRQPAVFYSLMDLTAVCANITADLPQADSSGSFVLGDACWSTIPVIARLLDLNEDTVRHHVKSASGLKKTEGKDVSGQVADFYLTEQVTEHCSHLLKEVPRAGKASTFMADGETWGTLKALRLLLQLKHDKPVQTRVARSGIKFREGRIPKGSIEKFYPLSKVKEVCADLLPGVLPTANMLGIVLIDDESWGTVDAIRRELGGLSRETADLLVLNPSVRSKRGKTHSGKPTTYFSLKDAQRLFRESPDFRRRLEMGRAKKSTPE